MIEVLWHGRGGQGAFTAARLLGAAVSLAEDRHALAFPSFGPERRGAPMRAFTKFSDGVIGDRSALSKADFVVYLDETLLADDWAAKLKPGGRVLVNSPRTFDDERIVALDADGISAKVFGRAIPNTVFLAALSVLCEQVDVESVKEAIRQYMPAKLHERNITVVEEVRDLMTSARDETSAPAAENDSKCEPRIAVRSGGEEAGGSETWEPGLAADEEPYCAGRAVGEVPAAVSCAAVRDASFARRGRRVPSLREDSLRGLPSLDPAEYARATCYQAGHLVTKNAGWRSVRPLLNLDACTKCLQCYLYCPDGTVYKDRSAVAVDAPAAAPASFANGDGATSADAAGAADAAAPADAPASAPTASPGDDFRIAIDYDFCKGCGICARICRFGAITMTPESEVSAR